MKKKNTNKQSKPILTDMPVRRRYEKHSKRLSEEEIASGMCKCGGVVWLIGTHYICGDCLKQS